FLDLIGKRSLLRAAVAAAALLTLERAPPLPLGFLLLSAGELLQLLEQLVDLTIGGLLGRLIGGLVAASHLMERLLEELGQLLLHGATTAATTTATLLHADLRLVFLFSLLKNLQRLVLRLQRLIRRHRAQLAFGFLHRGHGLRQQLRHFRKRRIALDQLAVDARQQTFHLLAQLRLRQPDDLRVLAQLVGADLLAIALHVERRRDHLTLLLGERFDLPATAATTATAAALRLRLTEVLLEWENAQEVEMAARQGRAAPAS